MEAYRTEEEQVEALRKWWDENGRSTIAAIIIAVSGAFAWQTYQGVQSRDQQSASDAYQRLVQAIGDTEQSAEGRQEALELAELITPSTKCSTASI